VVLVILIVGMFAIAQLFPGGFFSIGHTASVTLASSLSNRNEEYMLHNREQLPDAIVAVDPRQLDPLTGLGRIRAEIAPPDLHASQPYLDNPINSYTGPPPEDPRFSSVNQMRRVLGENVKLPPPTVAFGPARETVSLYRCLFSPIYSDGPMPGSALGTVAYAGTAMRRIVMEDIPTADDLEALFREGPFGYGINYEGAYLYFLAVDYDRTYKIEYSFRSAPNAPGQAIPENCVYAPAGTVPTLTPQGDPVTFVVQRYNLRTGGVDQLFQYDVATRQYQTAAGIPGTPPPDCLFVRLQNGQVLDLGSDLLFRRFRRLTLAQPFSPDPANGRTQLDPYEYKVYDKVLGLFGFHPAASTLPLPRQAGRGITARIDYDVDDWHILHQDEVVPQEFSDPSAPIANRYHTIRLATGPIKQLNEIEETINFPISSTGPGPVDTTYEYQGLVRFYPAYSRGGLAAPAREGTPGLDLIMVDLQTGLVIDSSTLQKPGVGLAGTNENGEIDYETGVIHLRDMVTFRLPGSPTDPNSLLGDPVPPAVPSAGRHLRVYYRAANDFAVATFKPASNYYLQSNILNLQHREFFAGYRSGYLVFNNTDADRSVTIDYSWLDRSIGTLHVETAELQKVQDPSLPGAPTPTVAGFDPTRHWWVRLLHSDVDPSKGTGDGQADPDVVPGSIQIRGVRGASIHTRVVWREGNNWRSRERSTILNRLLSR
jgi:hypothetical protein